MVREGIMTILADYKGRVAIVGIVVLLLVGYSYWQSFAAIELAEGLPADAVQISHGNCEDGDTAHSCEGNVSVMEVNGSYFLYFEDYDATDVPDVWFYMTMNGHEGDTDAVEEQGLLILVPQTMEESDGRAEVEGTFIIPLPDDFDPQSWNGLSVWCEDYNILVGSVEFTFNQ